MRSRRTWAVGGALLVVLYVAFAPVVGLAWPYPQRLPDRYHYRGYWYDNAGVCHAEPSRPLVASGDDMWTALGPIGRPAILIPASAARAATPPTFYVKSDSGCFQEYDGADLPGP